MEFSPLGVVAVVLELLNPVLPLLGALFAAWVALMGLVIARRQRLRVAPAVRGAAVVGVIGAVVAALAIPLWSGASPLQLQSVIDFFAVVGGGIGLGVATGVLSYPIIQLMVQKPA